MSRSIQITTPPITTVGSNAVVAVKVPIMAYLNRLWAYGPSTFKLDLFNRAFSFTAIDIQSITNDGNNKVLLESKAPLPLAVGDAVTVASCTVGGYNATHRVVSIENDHTIVTDKAFSANAVDGTIALAIPTGEEVLYRITDQLDGTSNVAKFNDSVGVAVVNQDPQPKGHSAKTGNLYIRFSAADTYRVALVFSLPD